MDHKMRRVMKQYNNPKLNINKSSKKEKNTNCVKEK
jgi:hypothetical protein